MEKIDSERLIAEAERKIARLRGTTESAPWDGATELELLKGLTARLTELEQERDLARGEASMAIAHMPSTQKDLAAAEAQGTKLLGEIKRIRQELHEAIGSSAVVLDACILEWANEPAALLTED